MSPGALEAVRLATVWMHCKGKGGDAPAALSAYHDCLDALSPEEAEEVTSHFDTLEVNDPNQKSGGTG